MMRRMPRWLVIAAVIVLACVGVKFWYDRLCSGDIDISDSAPSKEMLLHIIEHVDELAAQEELFSVTVDRGITTVTYTGNPDYHGAYFCYEEDSHTLLSAPNCEYHTSGQYHRSNHSDFWDVVTPASKINLVFSAYVVPPSCMLVLHQFDAPAVSDAPLREMMSAIESVIGTPDSIDLPHGRSFAFPDFQTFFVQALDKALAL
ncbi:MAG: hypothetical protein IJB81_12815 [Clostridia bacterium]|nr:hypothetical protein [Clostridia bacterium]